MSDIEQYVAGLKVTELREELKKHNQPTHGNKAVLCQRLREAMEKSKGEEGEEGLPIAAADEEEAAQEVEGEEVAASSEVNGEGGEKAAEEEEKEEIAVGDEGEQGGGEQAEEQVQETEQKAEEGDQAEETLQVEQLTADVMEPKGGR